MSEPVPPAAPEAIVVPPDEASHAAGQPLNRMPPLHGSVAAAQERLDGLAGTPLEGHVGVFDDVHRLLHDALTDLDDTP